MTLAGIVGLSAISLVLYVFGAICILKTDMLVERARRNYTNMKSKLIRRYTGSGMVMKSWYPTYLRIAGVVICLWALTIDCLVAFGKR